MLIYYHLILFSRKTTNADVRYDYGHSFLSLLCLIMVVNLIVTAVDSVAAARRRRRLDGLKSNYETRLAEATEIAAETQK